jgi:hypothetical protein
MERILLRQQEFTGTRVKMEDKVTLLAAVEILGLRAFLASIAAARKTPPTDEQLYQYGVDLVEALGEISLLKIEGEPSERNNLDTQVLSDKMRLTELLLEIPKQPSPEEALDAAIARGEQFRQMVELARRYCEAQTQALLNKLSRAYQKPDFCIRRDSVGSECDRLLPLSLSWDDNWFYGNELEYLLPLPLRPSPLEKSGKVSTGPKP